MPDVRFGWAYANLNVVAQPRQAVHQLALGEVGEITAHHVGNFWLSNAHPFGGFLLSQAKVTHGLSYLDHQARLDR